MDVRLDASNRSNSRNFVVQQFVRFLRIRVMSLMERPLLARIDYHIGATVRL